MTNSMVCSLPDTGIGLSLVVVAAVLVVIGVLLWRVPRTRRTPVMVAIAVPLAFLAATTEPADAATAACPEQETRLNWGDLNFGSPSTPTTSDPSPTTSSPTTSSPNGPTSYIVMVAVFGFPLPVVSGAGVDGEVEAGDWIGTLDLSQATNPPRISVSATGAISASLSFVDGGTCVDKDGNRVTDTGTYPFPWTCTITNDFALLAMGQS